MKILNYDGEAMGMEKRINKLVIGIVFIFVGFIVLYFNLSIIKGSFDKIWPALVLLIGMILNVFYFSTRKIKNRLFLFFIATFIAISSIPLFLLNLTSFQIPSPFSGTEPITCLSSQTINPRQSSPEWVQQ